MSILITGSPYYPMMFSRWLKRQYHKPIILDFQDPWVSNYGAAQSRLPEDRSLTLIASAAGAASSASGEFRHLCVGHCKTRKWLIGILGSTPTRWPPYRSEESLTILSICARGAGLVRGCQPRITASQSAMSAMFGRERIGRLRRFLAAVGANQEGASSTLRASTPCFCRE